MNTSATTPARAYDLSPRARILARIVSLSFNWHWVEPGLARAAQTYGWQTPLLLRHHRIRSMVNLRGENSGSPWFDNEYRACTDLGISFTSVSLSSKRLPEREHLLDVLAAGHDAPPPTLVKCSGGADRTGLVVGLYLLERRGLSAMPAARRQLAYWPYLHVPKPRQRWIRAFLDFVEVDAGGRSLRDWIGTTYSAKRFEDFLVARGQHRFWKRD